METFGEIYCSVSKNHPFEHTDACYILSYSTIMLNVDLHNPAVKTKKTMEQFISGNRGINNTKDLPRDMQIEIFKDIQGAPLRNPEELPSGTINALTYSDISLRIPRVADFMPADSLAQDDFARDLFGILWSHAISAICYVFEESDSQSDLQKTIAGFTSCARFAARHQLYEVFDYITIFLCKKSTLLTAPSERSAILFGDNVKAQLASITVFALAHDFGTFFREGWLSVLTGMATLRGMKLIDEVPLHTEVLREVDEKTNKAPTQRGWLSGLLWGNSGFNLFLCSSNNNKISTQLIIQRFLYHQLKMNVCQEQKKRLNVAESKKLLKRLVHLALKL